MHLPCAKCHRRRAVVYHSGVTVCPLCFAALELACQTRRTDNPQLSFNERDDARRKIRKLQRLQQELEAR